jgi:hypothetical protein
MGLQVLRPLTDAPGGKVRLNAVRFCELEYRGMLCDKGVELEKERDEACRADREAGNAGRTSVTRAVMRRDTLRCQSAENKLQEHIKTCPTCKANTSPI